MWFDSHTHIDNRKFDYDREQVIAQALAAGVSLMLNPGADLKSSRDAVALAEKHACIYAAVGVHPHDSITLDAQVLQELERLAAYDKVVAIGEIGLDYYYDHSPREVQRAAFIEQLRLAKKLNLPVIIHDRDAHGDVLSILKSEKAFDTGVLMHCFSGSFEMAREYVGLGAMLSIAGPVTYKNNQKTREVVEKIPLKHLLIETDSPYLTPIPFRGQRNESKYVPLTGACVADIKGISPEAVAEATMANGRAFFRIAP